MDYSHRQKLETEIRIADSTELLKKPSHHLSPHQRTLFAGEFVFLLNL